MLSRAPMPTLAPSRAERWDIFCTVIDNYGDIGVSWRLARQLAAEHGIAVRLWVDDLRSFGALCPTLDTSRERQQIAGVDIRRWHNVTLDEEESATLTEDSDDALPGEVVIEAFGCTLPEYFVAAMAERAHPPCWINLEYLSAEPWTLGCHGLSSPHPRWPLTKYFFFPGFDPNGGGLLREREVLAQRDARTGQGQKPAHIEHYPNLAPLPGRGLRISLFAYETPAITALLTIWAELATPAAPICCLIPASRALQAVATFFGQSLQPGDVCRRGALEIHVLPFVEQAHYDALLQTCDVNIVRGEDSFVRAQWAAKPLLWHIYPQDEDAHCVKLDAFLDIYCAALPAAASAALRRFWHGWNAGELDADTWCAFADALPTLTKHAAVWSARLAEQEDLASRLVLFCRARV
ncbi:elongation factor P maturation arginine rhamnosyltransferase EarP [Rhodocyclus tenuis]|uniref:Protein-arginine rhamnosyltransferase n=2 Tax=Rhodocyclus TaxID=1064 RepID=A0A6L5JTX9_RHOTE|nr:elongation factor P maturation arginine rhamnosyltransferase EarP [Rhodocyclus gracilis]